MESPLADIRFQHLSDRINVIESNVTELANAYKKQSAHLQQLNNLMIRISEVVNGLSKVVTASHQSAPPAGESAAEAGKVATN